MRGDRRLHTNAVVAALTANLPAEVKVWDGERPSGSDGDPPGVLVEREDVIDASERLDEVEREFDGVYRLTCVHVGREHVEWLEGEAIDASKNVTVAGRHVLKTETTPSGGYRAPDLDNNDPFWISTPTVRLWTTPA